MSEDIGDRYQRETKYSKEKLKGPGLDWASKPETYKHYPEASQEKLPSPAPDGEASLWSILKARRSVRSFGGSPLAPSELSLLLWATQGITGRIHGYDLRAAPSAGALYPIETYLVLQAVEGLHAGIYHYNIREHSLELISAGDFRKAVSEAALSQDFIEDASAVFIWTAIFQRSKWKYRERAYRYVYLDAGHIGQNLALAAVALGLGSCQIAAFFDDAVDTVIGVDGKKESAVYMTAVGRKKTGKDGWG